MESRFRSNRGRIASEIRQVDRPYAQSEEATIRVRPSTRNTHRLPLQASVERAFSGFDLSNIRSHTGPAAASSARSLGSRAYAYGTDIVFRDRSPDLETVSHEVSHVLQQQSARVSSGSIERLEREAQRVAKGVARGEGAWQYLPVTKATRQSPFLQRIAVTRTSPARETQTTSEQTERGALNVLIESFVDDGEREKLARNIERWSASATHAFEVSRSLTGAGIEGLAGGVGGAFRFSARLRVPVYGALYLLGTMQCTVHHVTDPRGFKIGAGANLGFSLGSTGDGGEASFDYAIGSELEAFGATGRQAVDLLFLGLERTVRSIDEEPPPVLIQGLLPKPIGETLVVVPLVEALGIPVPDVWEKVADALFRGLPAEVVAEMTMADYVELVDRVAAGLSGKAAAEGQGEASAAMQGSLELRRRWQLDEDAGLEEVRYQTVSLEASFEGKGGSWGFEGTFDCLIPVSEPSPRSGNMVIGARLSLDITQVQALASTIAKALVEEAFGGIEQSIRAEIEDSQSESLRARSVVQRVRLAFTDRGVNTLEDVLLSGIHSIPGVEQVYSIEFDVDLESGEVTVGLHTADEMEQEGFGVKLNVGRTRELAHATFSL